MNQNNETVVAGFWRRTVALLLDFLLLILIGNGLGLLLGEWFSSLGHWGRLVGFIIATVYFGVLNSGISNGQTLGKKLLKIAVVNKQGKTISLAMACARFAIFGIPFFLSGIELAQNQMQGPVFYLALFVVLGPLFTTFYLYLFNRTTRQCLHDWLLGTYVVPVSAAKQQRSSEKLGNAHRVVVMVLFVLAAVAPYLVVQSQQSEEQLNILLVINALQQNPVVRSSTLRQDQRTIKFANKPKALVNMVAADITLNRNLIEQKMLAQSLVVVLLREYPAALEADVLQVNLRYGFDIGIARGWQEMAYQFDPKMLNPQ